MRRYFIILPLSYMLLIFITSSIPFDTNAREMGRMAALLRPRVQNLLHIPAYALLAMLWVIAFRRLQYEKSVYMGTSTVISIGYGFLDEVHQYFVPGRYMSVTDVFFNAVGVVLAISFCGLFLSNKKK